MPIEIILLKLKTKVQSCLSCPEPKLISDLLLIVLPSAQLLQDTPVKCSFFSAFLSKKLSRTIADNLQKEY